MIKIKCSGKSPKLDTGMFVTGNVYNAIESDYTYTLFDERNKQRVISKDTMRFVYCGDFMRGIPTNFASFELSE